MKMNKIISCAAAAAMALSMAAFSASAADWSKTGYADEAPESMCVVSTDANGATWEQIEPGVCCKIRITLTDIIADPADADKIASGTYTITYKGLSALNGTDIGWLGGGTYCGSCNSTGWSLAPAEVAEDGTVTWDDEVSVEDSFKYLLPSQKPTADGAGDFEFVFMDWSGQDLTGKGITFTVSDLKLFDDAGNEIAQKEYSGEAAAAVEETVEETVEEVAEETVAAETTEEVAPASDNTSASASTGNASAAAIASVMAVAGVAAIAAKKRK